MSTKKLFDTKDIKRNTLWAALGYAWIISGVIALASGSPFARFHAKQGMVLTGGTLLVFFPIVGWVIGITCWILLAVGMVRALHGQTWRIPVVGAIAERYLTF